jgi:hypothetical protein
MKPATRARYGRIEIGPVPSDGWLRNGFSEGVMGKEKDTKKEEKKKPKKSLMEKRAEKKAKKGA